MACKKGVLRTTIDACKDSGKSVFEYVNNGNGDYNEVVLTPAEKAFVARMKKIQTQLQQPIERVRTKTKEVETEIPKVETEIQKVVQQKERQHESR